MTARLHVWVTPGARRSEVVGLEGNEVRIRLGAPAVENRANRELLLFLSRTLDVPPTSVVLLRGAGSRHKVLEIQGLAADDALRRLGL